MRIIAAAVTLVLIGLSSIWLWRDATAPAEQTVAGIVVGEPASDREVPAVDGAAADPDVSGAAGGVALLGARLGELAQAGEEAAVRVARDSLGALQEELAGFAAAVEDGARERQAEADAEQAQAEREQRAAPAPAPAPQPGPAPQPAPAPAPAPTQPVVVSPSPVTPGDDDWDDDDWDDDDDDDDDDWDDDDWDDDDDDD